MVPWMHRRLRAPFDLRRSVCRIRCLSGLWRKLKSNSKSLRTQNGAMEVVYEGWLVKSPPERRIRRAKWRRRWFVLRPSGQVPQQYVLEYYTDQTYRKLKGTIDLDQCDQVDAELEVVTKSKFMFDIKTSKRTYYLVADSEAIMNKWVDCICKVCGLRMRVETEGGSEETQAEASSEPAKQSLPSDESPIPAEPAPPSLSTAAEHPSSLSNDDSNPYIPISECITGKPVGNGLPRSCPESKLVDFYDTPRCSTGRTSPDPVMDAMCRMPRPPEKPVRELSGASLLDSTVPAPKVNWNTYPEDSPAPGMPASGQALNYDPVPPLRPTSSREDVVEPATSQSSNVYNGDTLGRAGLTLRKAGRAGMSVPPAPLTRQNATEESYDRPPAARPSSACNNAGSTADITGDEVIPPRPPKPANIRIRPVASGYDVPPPPSQQPRMPQQDSYDVPRSAGGMRDGYSIPPCPVPVLRHEAYDVPAAPSRGPYELYDLPRSAEPVPRTASGGIPLPPRLSLDETYDFPKSAMSPDGLNLSVPAPAAPGSRKHAYCNAPVGTFNSRENIFNYEYRPSFTEFVAKDDGDAQQAPPGAYANLSSNSPSTPNLAAVPPAINRGLKPRKASTEGTSPGGHVFPLAPPPVNRSRSHTTSGRPRQRSKGDLLAPDEDCWSNASSSRRNSTNDDPGIRQPSAGAKKKGEIQYLDLDLDSDPAPAQSPRSPEQRTGGTSTVYRTVDFVKTKAFNTTRQDVEESYRSHKDGEPCK
ncbi:GRB2-associated-binding protein 1 [Rhipicephalus sanguineus]|nr:GRB2-associated-binding protein 1 [Rhipicephalus sanguineus]